MIYFLFVKKEIGTLEYLKDIKGSIGYLGALNGHLYLTRREYAIKFELEFSLLSIQVIVQSQQTTSL